MGARLLRRQGQAEAGDIERTWHDPKRHDLAHHTLKDAADLTRAIHAAVMQVNEERQTPRPCDKLTKAA